jgi:hypothetical protein
MEWEHIEGSNYWNFYGTGVELLAYIHRANNSFKLCIWVTDELGFDTCERIVFPTLEEAQSVGKLLAACQPKE